MTGRHSKNTSYIQCNRFISLIDVDGQLMDLILHKGSSTNSGHYLSMVKVGDIWFECDNVKITKIELNHFYNSNTAYMLFLQKNYMIETFMGHWACPYGCLVSLDINLILFVLDLHLKYTVEVVPLCTYIVCLLLCDNNPICKKCWSCFCIPLHS